MKKTLTEDLKEGNTAEDYSRYTMKFQDRLVAFVVAFFGAAAAMHIFFGNIVVSAVAGVALGIYAQKIYLKMRIKSRQRDLLMQFKDFLDVLNAAVSSGMTTAPAFRDAEERMISQFGADALFCRELSKVNYDGQIEGGVENAFYQFAVRTYCRDIVNFARVILLAKQQGGNVRSIIQDARNTISGKIDIERDIETSISNTRNQFYVLMLMPLIVIPIASSIVTESNPVISVITRIIALFMFAIAFAIGNKITDIKL